MPFPAFNAERRWQPAARPATQALMRPGLSLMLPALLAGWLACTPALGATAQPVQAEGQIPASVASIEEQFRRGEQGQALQRLHLALTQRPQDGALRFLQGVLLSDIGRSDEAAQVFQDLIGSFPELPEPYNNLAVLRAAQGQLDNALALLQSALRLAPDYRTAHENLGDVYLRLAMRAYERAAQGAQTGSALANKLRQARELAQVR